MKLCCSRHVSDKRIEHMWCVFFRISRVSARRVHVNVVVSSHRMFSESKFLHKQKYLTSKRSVN